MADSVIDPTTTGDGTDSFDLSQVISDSEQTAAQAFTGYEQSQTALKQQQTTLQLSALNSSTYVTLAIILAAVIVVPRLL